MVKSSGKWRAGLYHNGKDHTLGSFACEEEAARAYDAGAAHDSYIVPRQRAIMRSSIRRLGRQGGTKISATFDVRTLSQRRRGLIVVPRQHLNLPDAIPTVEIWLQGKVPVRHVRHPNVAEGEAKTTAVAMSRPARSASESVGATGGAKRTADLPRAAERSVAAAEDPSWLQCCASSDESGLPPNVGPGGLVSSARYRPDSSQSSEDYDYVTSSQELF